MPRTKPCPTCSGLGIVADFGPLGTDFEGDKPCRECGGNGYVPADSPHDLYKTGDADAPEVIKDRNGEVVLGLCRSCNKGEAELDGLCDAEDIYATAAEAICQQMPDIDLTDTTPVPGRMANQTWRILEEQRQAADDTIRECDAEIERWTNKLVDAMKTKGMCEAGQRALDGGA